MGETRDVSEKYPLVLRVRSAESEEEVVYYSILYEDFPEQFRLVAERELNETDEKRETGMHRLKELIQNENIESLSDIYLLAMLRCSKFNLKKAEAKLRNFITKRRAFIIKLAKVDLAKVEKILDDMPIGLLPYRDKHGRIIMFTQPTGVNPDSYDYHDLSLFLQAMILFQFFFPISTVSGVSNISDCKTPAFVRFYYLFQMGKCSISTVLSYPFRLGRIDYMNETPLAHWLCKMIKAILPEKFGSRMFFHGNSYASLHKYYDPNILPDLFAGNLGPLSNEIYKQRLFDFIKELKAEGEPNA